MYQYLKDRKGFKKYDVLDGESDLTIPNYLPNSFNRHTMNSVIRKPYLVFNYVIKTHQFNPSQFFNPIPQVREKLHHEIDILHQLGWGYTKIHHHLVNNGFKIGESRTTVDKILKKMKKRETFLTQPIMDGFTEYSVEVFES